MTKLKTPLLSFDAHGSLGEAITFQKRGKGTMVREKPIPSQPRTLPQLYHRLDYKEYSTLWQELTPAQKQQWESDARRAKITGFNLWLRQKLSLLPDLRARWYLDEQGIKVFDSSKNTNTGTVYGAISVPGVLDRALWFDGVDNYVVMPDHPSLRLQPPFSIEFFMNADRVPIGAWNLIMGMTSVGSPYYGYAFGMWAPRIYFRVAGVAAWFMTITTGTLYYIVGTYDGAKVRIYVNKVLGGNAPALTGPVPYAYPPYYFHLGKIASTVANYTYKGLFDHVTLYNRILTAEDQKRHMERRL